MFVSDGTTSRRVRQVSVCMARVRGGEFPGGLFGGPVGGVFDSAVGGLPGGRVGGVVVGSVGGGAWSGGHRAAAGHLTAGTGFGAQGTGQPARDRRRPIGSAAQYRPDPAHTGPPALRVVVEVIDRVWWWRLSGQLRAGSLAVLEANVDLLGAARCDQVMVDLRDLTEVDDVGCKVLLGLHHYMTARGGRLGIAGATPLVARALQAAGVTHVDTNVTPA